MRITSSTRARKTKTKSREHESFNKKRKRKPPKKQFRGLAWKDTLWWLGWRLVLKGVMERESPTSACKREKGGNKGWRLLIHLM